MAGSAKCMACAARERRYAPVHMRLIAGFFSRSIVAATSGGSDRKPSCPDRREQRPQMRTLEEGRLAVGRHQLIEDQYQRDRDQADAHRAKRGAAEPIADPGVRRRWPHPAPCAPACRAPCRRPGTVPKNSNEFCDHRRVGLPDLRCKQRHRPHRDRHRDQIGQYRDRAAQQPGVEAGDHGNDQREIDDDVEAVHARPRAGPCYARGSSRKCSAIAQIVAINARVRLFMSNRRISSFRARREAIAGIASGAPTS